ncbi:hypothetical protein PHSY_001724 [Pseudozyma hubeiensis SY62]|uniref:Uncharacterized protein n=1 Tax=Pseudozyma hubeiensis (strain SY62) TaxID=1305764 RepID=R9P7R8_PSEHS|nr:hypothetical protein PHSY_001724 [Pseudozyma hubeiensis SY62]GAC94155.1 hypothetical protein PHSY_001724 [Pseudozyma hubeiensis SY62]
MLLPSPPVRSHQASLKMVSSKQSKRSTKRVLALLAVASALSSVAVANAASVPGRSWFRRQDASLDSAEAQILKLITADGPYATMTGSGSGAIQSAVGLSGDAGVSSAASVASANAASAVAATDAADVPTGIIQAVQASSSPSASPDKVASGTLDPSLQAQLQSEWDQASGSKESGVQSWTYDPGAYGCGLGKEGGDVATATLCSANLAAAATPTAAASERAANASPEGAFQPVSAATGAARRRRALPTPEPQPHRRQYPIDDGTFNTVSDLFPLFTSYVTLDPPSTTRVYFGPTSNLNTTVPRRGTTDSGNGEAPSNINNPNSPDLGWLDVQVGAVPYKNGDLIASIVWILATIALIPLLLIRCLRRSSLISMILFTILVYMILMLATFGVRAKISNDTPTTTLMNVEGIILAVLIPLLIEPLLHLLGLYSKQSGRSTGVPTAALVLRILNFIVFLLFLIAAAYFASWLDKWNKALQMTQTAQDLPSIVPPKITRIGPVVGSVVEIIVILGAALLIPVARGDSGSAKPGGFIFLLLLLLFISTVYRLLQSLHATTRISAELGGDLNANDLLPFFQGGSSNSTTDNQRVANGLSLAPQGMYGPRSEGIDWNQLQLTMASRGTPQTPLIFNLVYVLPMWLMVFLLFFAHAPAGKKEGEAADVSGGNVAVAKA